MKITVKLFSIVMALTMMASCTSKLPPKAYNKGVHVVPQPNQLEQKEGTFELNSKTKFVSTGDTKTVVDYFAAKIKNASGFELAKAEKASSNFIAVNVNPAMEIKKEGYTLSVTPKGITVNAKTAQGAFYGMQTVMQLLPAEIESTTVIENMAWTAPCAEIKDEPRFPYRGMHLDVCRHFYPVDFVKKQIDVLAMFKMNTFHWHLTEDQGWRIEIKKYPKLTEIGSKRMEGEGYEYGGYYTQEQVKEIVKYAQERFVTVIPEIELPGHALGALTAYPEYSCTGGPFKVRNIWGVEPDVYCAGKEETFAFLEDIIEEVVALFPSEYFHIGGDECPKDRWKVCPLCKKRMKQEGLKNAHELQSYFIKRIEKVLIGHGKKMIGWDEILEGGLAPSATVMSWRGEKGGIEAAKEGHDVIMTPGNWCYLDHYQGSSNVEPVAIGGYTTLEESYSYDPLPKELDAEKHHFIQGTQGNVWSEYMYDGDLAEYRIYPRIIALAEVNWTQKENKDYTDFLRRMDNNFVRLDLHNINYHIPLAEGPNNHVAFTDKATIEFTTTRPMKIVYTTDGTEPTVDSPVYAQPLELTANTTIKAATVLLSGKMSKVRTINVVKESFAPAADVKTTGKGLKMKTTDGTFIKVADLKKATKWEEKTFNPEKAKGLFDYKKPSAAVFTGYIDIAEDGIYEFATNVDQLFIGEKLLINNDGEVKRFSRNNSSVALAKGKHAVKIIFLNNVIGGWPQSWNGPNVQFKKAGAEKFENIKAEMLSF